MTISAEHWEGIYSREPSELNWYQVAPAVSLEMIDALGVEPGAAVVDVGGGASPLAGRLLGRGFRDITVLDIAEEALAAGRARLSSAVGDIHWLRHDVRSWRPDRRFDLWHDRAAFHFLVDPVDQAHYLAVLESALAPGGAVVLATFASDGPTNCSGLPVARYDATALAAALGPEFELVREQREEHRTPSGVVQPFTWVALRRTR